MSHSQHMFVLTHKRAAVLCEYSLEKINTATIDHINLARTNPHACILLFRCCCYRYFCCFCIALSQLAGTDIFLDYRHSFAGAATPAATTMLRAVAAAAAAMVMVSWSNSHGSTPSTLTLADDVRQLCCWCSVDIMAITSRLGVREHCGNWGRATITCNLIK